MERPGSGMGNHASQQVLGDELALLVDAVQDYAIFLLDPEGRIRSWNQGAGRITGYTADEVIGHHFSMFYPPEAMEARKPERELEIAAAEGRVEDEGWRVRRDGQRFWVNTIITALRDEQKQLIGFAKVTRDLTERRSAEERLRESEEMFRLLVESVKDYAIFVLDPTGHIASWNAGAHRIKGYTAAEIIGRHFSTFYPDEDIRAGKPEMELEVATKHGSYEEEGWRLRKDGTRFWANVIITAIFDSTGQLRGFAKVTRDITERKQAEEIRSSLFEQREARLRAEEERRSVEASYLAAQEANRAKDAFLMTLSHEMRTPMTAILGWARMLPAISPNDEMFREAVASIARSAEVQAKLIDDVLDVSRVVSGKLRLVRENVDVGRILRSSLDAVRAMAEGRGVTMVVSIEPDIGVLVADPTRLQQIVWNLLTNAVKFTPRGGRVVLIARRTASEIEITVVDTGAGIEAAFLPHVFEPFRQAETPSTRVHGGLGLGLSIVRYLVEAHGGTVSAESRGRGLGSKFSVMLPIQAGTVSPSGESWIGHQELAAIGARRLRDARILIVDDDREARMFLRAALTEAGGDVSIAASAPDALQKFDARPPHLVLTDVAMPGTDGYELARSIRRREAGSDVKIVALSAFPSGARAAEISGFDAYLRKPIDPNDLVEAIARVIGR